MEKLKSKDILDRENAMIMRQSPKWLQTFAILMVSLGIGLIGSSYFIRIEEVVTAQGLLKAKGGREDVETPAGGKVKSVLFKNGDYVNKGDLLLIFDTTQAREEANTYARMIFLEKKTLEGQKTALKLKQKTLYQQIATQKEILEGYTSLNKIGGISRMQYLQSKDRLFELENQSNSLIEQMNNIEFSAEKQIRNYESKLDIAKLQLKYQNVKSGTNGIIFDLKLREGGVIEPGAKIMSIVPDKGLTAEVFVPNKDIGFVKLGQKANVRVDAFPAQRYGELAGKVSLIGADSLPPTNTVSYYHFPVKIDLSESQLMVKNTIIPLRSGMAITTNLQIRDKRAITLISDFFSDPLDSIKSLR